MATRRMCSCTKTAGAIVPPDHLARHCISHFGYSVGIVSVDYCPGQTATSHVMHTNTNSTDDSQKTPLIRHKVMHSKTYTSKGIKLHSLPLPLPSRTLPHTLTAHPSTARRRRENSASQPATPLCTRPNH